MGLDSIELLMEVEKQFSISIPDSEAEKAWTVGKLVDCVAKIIGAKSYDFSLREKTFELIRKELLRLNNDLLDFSINDPVSNSLDVRDKNLIVKLENQLQLKLPGIDTKTTTSQGILAKFQKWLEVIEDIDFEKTTWKKYIDIILAVNLEHILPLVQYKSKYEIYITLMRIIVDKTGVLYTEIGIEKSFSDDLGG